MPRTPAELKKLIEDPATWAGAISVREAQWTAAFLAQLVTVLPDGGVSFPTAAIHVCEDVTIVALKDGFVTRSQMLVGLEALAKSGLLNFSRQTANITLLTGYRDLVTGLIQ